MHPCLAPTSRPRNGQTSCGSRALRPTRRFFRLTSWRACMRNARPWARSSPAPPRVAGAVRSSASARVSLGAELRRPHVDEGIREVDRWTERYQTTIMWISQPRRSIPSSTSIREQGLAEAEPRTASASLLDPKGHRFPSLSCSTSAACAVRCRRSGRERRGLSTPPGGKLRVGICTNQFSVMDSVPHLARRDRETCLESQWEEAGVRVFSLRRSG